MPDGLSTKLKLKRSGRCDKRHTTCKEADQLRLLTFPISDLDPDSMVHLSDKLMPRSSRRSPQRSGGVNNFAGVENR